MAVVALQFVAMLASFHARLAFRVSVKIVPFLAVVEHLIAALFVGVKQVSGCALVASRVRALLAILDHTGNAFVFHQVESRLASHAIVVLGTGFAVGGPAHLTETLKENIQVELVVIIAFVSWKALDALPICRPITYLALMIARLTRFSVKVIIGGTRTVQALTIDQMESRKAEFTLILIKTILAIVDGTV